MTATPPGSVSAGPANPERLLSDVLSGFARTQATDFPMQAILDHPVAQIVDVLPISTAGVIPWH